MIVIRNLKDIETHNHKDGNHISGVRTLTNSSITFKGSNNVLMGDDVDLKNSRLVFQGSNSLIYLSNSHRVYILTVSIWNNNTLYIGKNCSFNGAVSLSLSEERSIFIGDTCMFSAGITFDTADPHLIYSTENQERINPSKDIILGDHIWGGRNVSFLKGVRVHSGSIVALGSVVSGSKEIPSNCVVGGTPAKVISENVFWLPNCVHSYTAEKTEISQHYKDRKFVYNDSPTSQMIDFDEITRSLFHQSMVDRMKFLKYISCNDAKYRFALK